MLVKAQATASKGSYVLDTDNAVSVATGPAVNRSVHPLATRALAGADVIHRNGEAVNGAIRTAIDLNIQSYITWGLNFFKMDSRRVLPPRKALGAKHSQIQIFFGAILKKGER